MTIVPVLGLPVRALTRREALNTFEGWIAAPRRDHRVVTLNAEMAQAAVKDAALAAAIMSADLVVPDGVGIVWAARRAGNRLPERLPGVELVLDLAEAARAKGWRLYLLGARPGVAQEAGRRLQEQYPGLNIVGTHHGYFGPGEEEAVIEDILRAKPHILLAALGVPRQEVWLHTRAARLRVPVMMGVGGSFDVISGVVARAPAWVQRAGLEWAYRLCTDPRRWRRAVRLPLFVWSVWRRHSVKGDGVS